MKPIAALLASLLILPASVLGAAPAETPRASRDETVHQDLARELRSNVFEIRYADPQTLKTSLNLLGSGAAGSGIQVNPELRTITVRDFPENVATIEAALRRLDRPAAQRPEIGLELSILIGAEAPLQGARVPAVLEPVVAQLRSTLRYAHYGLMAATLHRTKQGHGIEGSGVADATLLGVPADQERPMIYRYRLRQISTSTDEPPLIEVDNIDFSINFPVAAGNGTYQYTPVGFATPVSIRAGEKVVIGTTTMGARALIVVITAQVMTGGAAAAGPG